jgi:hypothetical protein
MAVNNDYSAAPKGLASLKDDDVDSLPITELEDGTLEMNLDGSDPVETEAEPVDEEFYRNLVDDLSEEELEEIGAKVIENFEADRSSRSMWERTITKGLSLLGLELEELSEPFEGACSAHHPLIIESAVKFQSKASPELLPADGPVRTQILGNCTPEKEMKAERVKDFLNYQLTNVMSEYYEDTEKMLFWLPIVGSAFKKTYFSPTLNRPKSEFISCDQFVAPFSATSLKTAPRYSHIIYKVENDLRKDMVSGLYKEYEFGDKLTPSIPTFSDIRRKMDAILGVTPSNSDEAYTLVEQHVDLNLPGKLADEDGISLPYIVTVDYGSRCVLSIRRNWKQDDETRQRRDWFTQYQFVPGLGFYGVGFIHLLGNLETTLTTVLRSLTDSGQFANMQGGFKLKGMRIIGDNQAIAPGEFKEVEAAVMDLSKAIYPLPFKEPSTVLYQMLEFLERRGQQFADSTEQIIADSTNYGPVGTTVALLEASMKFFTAIHKRAHFSQKNEFKILVDINVETLPDEYPYDVPGASRTILKEDFDGSIEVLPASDPNIAAKSQRVMMAEAVLAKAAQWPQFHDLKNTLRYYYITLGVKNPEQFLPNDEEATPNDPITDIEFATKGKPIKAFPGQNHDAHVQIKTAFIQDPANGASPFMQVAVQPLLANIREHMLLKYKEQIGGFVQQSGAQDEQTLDMVMAEAANQIMQANQMAAQNSQISDPERMVAEAEMVKAKAQAERVKVEAFDKMSKNAIDAKMLEIEKMRIIQKAAETDAKLAADIKKQLLKDGSQMVRDSLNNQQEVADLRDKVSEAKRQAKEKAKPVAKKPK